TCSTPSLGRSPRPCELVRCHGRSTTSAPWTGTILGSFSRSPSRSLRISGSLLSAATFGERLSRRVAGFAVSAVAVATGGAGGAAQVAQEFGGSIFSECGDGVPVCAVGVGVEVGEPGHGAVPAQ